MGFIKFILYFLLFYFGIKIIFRFFGPMIIQFFIKKMAKKLGADMPDFNTKKEKPLEKKEKKKVVVGEYIDYEEIK
jgi:hypothetical protein